MKRTNLLVFFLLVTFYSFPQESSLFENPVIPGDMADPSIIRVGDTYYATATSSEWAPFYPVFTSTSGTCFRRETGMDFPFVLGAGIVLS